MNYWIKDHRPALLEVLKGLDMLLINDTETRMLTGEQQSCPGCAQRSSKWDQRRSSSSTANMEQPLLCS